MAEPTIKRESGKVSVTYPSDSVWKYAGQTVSYYNVPGTGYEIKQVGEGPVYDPRTGTLIAGGQGYSVSPEKAGAMASQIVKPTTPSAPSTPAPKSYLAPQLYSSSEQQMSVREDMTKPKTYTSGLWSMKKTITEPSRRMSPEEQAFGQSAATQAEFLSGYTFTQSPQQIEKIAKEKKASYPEAAAAYGLETFVVGPAKWAFETIPTQSWTITAAQIAPMIATGMVFKGVRMASASKAEVAVSFGKSDVFAKENLGYGITKDVTVTSGKNVFTGMTESLLRSDKLTEIQTEVKGLHVSEITSKSGKPIKALTATKGVSIDLGEGTTRDYGIGKTVRGNKVSNIAERSYTYKISSVKYGEPQAIDVKGRTAAYESVTRYKSIGESANTKPKLLVLSAGITDVYKLTEPSKPIEMMKGGMGLKQSVSSNPFAESMENAKPEIVKSIESSVRSEMAKTSPIEKSLSLRASSLKLKQNEDVISGYIQSPVSFTEQRQGSGYTQAIEQSQNVGQAQRHKVRTLEIQEPRVSPRMAVSSLSGQTPMQMQIQEMRLVQRKKTSLSQLSGLVRPRPGTFRPPSLPKGYGKPSYPSPSQPSRNRYSITLPKVRMKQVSMESIGFRGFRAGLADLTSSVGLKGIKPAAGFFGWKRRRRR